MSVISPELAGWLAENPSWDPRVRLADVGDRERVAALTDARSIRLHSVLLSPPAWLLP